VKAFRYLSAMKHFRALSNLAKSDVFYHSRIKVHMPPADPAACGHFTLGIDIPLTPNVVTRVDGKFWPTVCS
jgi:hypothetical protein